MARRLPSLNALKAFEAAARLESFTEAAGELFVTHAAISRHIRDLEEWLGTQLFLRTGRGVELTEAGRALAAADAPLRFPVRCDPRSRRPGNARTLNVSVEPAIASRWLVRGSAASRSFIPISNSTSTPPRAWSIFAPARPKSAFAMAMAAGPTSK